ncbi:hypothetical protein A2313_02555 [Candidatus Roizmanbacteria bacterium RIFOXYB2_FULL_41_10]|uniref:Uncharacterized protein n=1 Tax=Candidatus Roizmanbacteria bacterium RIFOXYA1_FULL_41_12 TaxID=1802082 RepID=A0A1F7K9X3_9BACT|nr:MAG: hypothetical protein A2209_01285 [Candidatus Roizmanbacteria bacterium RIFOXYA1_FULL_41_12]OGK66709.1 MAG: hypothetical protein A2377_02260 [Candidatus Roizmanbacteria bacterium RIFOXYB1_FULL_41_27]OGK68554.1 MAG: hypothetical protein A2262_04220 [Candidatus Roizmanbacteria bacterium RIFOXYA2_FULL_41_8]OGK70622.1 MAG: hypothetical protein A2313_02555 [Candidatus Roizmanbacteria bacterium RIFOXYB2_FULL_41_10]OGK70917.1 MAG: hypothetical protein A2403_02450 [Candidatus Roizmanbacteria bac
MPKKPLIFQIIGVVFTLVLAVIFSVSSLAKYDLQLVALLFIIYFFTKRRFGHSSGMLYFEAWLFVFIITSTVFSTGGVVSPFFFLLYFLLFAVALILDPLVGLVLTITLVIMFLSLSNFSANLKELLPVLSLPFIAPFAKYLGDLQRRYFQQKNELKHLEKARQKSNNLQAYEKEQTLIFLNTVFQSHLDDINDRLKNFMGDSDLEYLKHKVEELEKAFDSFEDYIEKLN